MWEPLNLPFGKQIWRRVLAHETPAGRYFGTVPAGVFCMPAHARIFLRGQGGRAVSWLYAVDSAAYSLYRGHRGIALIDWKYRGPQASNLKMVAGERTHLHRQTNTDKRIQAGEEAQPLNPTAPSSPEPPR